MFGREVGRGGRSSQTPAELRSTPRPVDLRRPCLAQAVSERLESPNRLGKPSLRRVASRSPGGSRATWWSAGEPGNRLRCLCSMCSTRAVRVPLSGTPVLPPIRRGVQGDLTRAHCRREFMDRESLEPGKPTRHGEGATQDSTTMRPTVATPLATGGAPPASPRARTESPTETVPLPRQETGLCVSRVAARGTRPSLLVRRSRGLNRGCAGPTSDRKPCQPLTLRSSAIRAKMQCLTSRWKKEPKGSFCSRLKRRSCQRRPTVASMCLPGRA